uniref:Core shell protein Gag P30 domain-containing protein n=1 Tax=Pseudonaja textilis TaxID=8673 RepID=A0A670YLL4_PSETE
MGGGESVPLPSLGCMLKHFKETYESQDYGLKWSRHKVQMFCEGECPTFGMGWPAIGTLNTSIAVQVHQLAFHPTLGHPDQAPYIDLNKSTPVMTSCPEELPHPSPYVPPLGLRRMSDEEESSGASGLIARLDQISPLMRSPGDPPDTIDRSAQADLSPPWTSAQAEPVAAGTRAKTEQTSLTAPLRQVDHLVTDHEDPTASVNLPLFQHVPFTMSDLLNWKLHYGPFSEKPTEVAALVKTIVDTHNPTWMDLQQFMGTLFNPEEREKIKNAVTEILKPEVRADGNLAAHVEAYFPSQDPKWNPYQDTDHLQDYQSIVVQAICLAGKPSVNMSKLSLVLQDPTESPKAFYARLIDAYRMYTPIDPIDPANAQMLTMAFISQNASDIRRKLQRLEGALGKPMTRGNRSGLGHNQCAICKKEEHWKGECAERNKEKRLDGRRGNFRGHL